MAIAVIMDFEGATLEQYDQLIERMGLSGGDAPPGALFHWVAETGYGIRVVDVWESREGFDRFNQEQIGPNAEAVGIKGRPKARYHAVHNVIRA